MTSPPGITWAICLALEDARATAPLRARSDVFAHVDRELWLAGQNDLDDLASMLTRIPARGRYRVLEDGQLVALGSRVPRGFLPHGSWILLQQWMAFCPPVAALAGQMPTPVPLQLQATSTTSNGARALLLEAIVWRDYAATAPSVRLAPLAFALSVDGRVLLRGTPPVPLPGAWLVDDHGILLPVGYSLVPRVGGKIVREVLGLNPEDVALFHEDGSYEKIAGEFLVHATRAAVRATFAAWIARDSSMTTVHENRGLERTDG